MPIPPTAMTESDIFLLLSLLISLFAVSFIVIMQNNPGRIIVGRPNNDLSSQTSSESESPNHSDRTLSVIRGVGRGLQK